MATVAPQDPTGVGGAEPPVLQEATEDGSEEYAYVSTEADLVVLSVPGIRDLKFQVSDARTIGYLMLKNADDADNWIKSHKGDNEEKVN